MFSIESCKSRPVDNLHIWNDDFANCHLTAVCCYHSGVQMTFLIKRSLIYIFVITIAQMFPGVFHVGLQQKLTFFIVVFKLLYTGRFKNGVIALAVLSGAVLGVPKHSKKILLLKI